MSWKECEAKYVRKISPDSDKIHSISETSMKRLTYIQSTAVNEENVSFIVEGLYEVIKELLVALLLKNGLRSSNHQCLISYFYANYPEHEDKAHLVSRLNYLRNRLNYYGEVIEIEFYTKNKDECIKIINTLRDLIKK